MKIGIVAPLAESVPPSLYGGTERVVSNLTEELTERGHSVTLFASGDSKTAAELVPCAPRALWRDENAPDLATATLFQLGEVYRRANEFDLIHSHVEWYGLPFAECVQTPTLTTIHGRLDRDDIVYRYGQVLRHPLVAISNDQRRFMPRSHWLETVYNGIDLSQFHLRTTPGDYLVFLGRLSADKGPEAAVEVARRTGMRLIVAAKIDPMERDYYESVLVPLFKRSPRVEFIGEVDEAAKDELLGGAYAYLFPIVWPEPFGLTMIEAMATGTPVLAMDRGSTPEIVADGVTGFLARSVREMVAAVEQVASIDRRCCRERVEQLFSRRTMADGYEAVYGQLLESARAKIQPAIPSMGAPA